MPACAIQAGERNIARAQHQGQHEISECGRDAGNDEQENHDRAVQGEHLVIHIGVHDRLFGSQKLGAHEHGKEAAKEQGGDNGNEIQHTDALVVDRHDPRP